MLIMLIVLIIVQNRRVTQSVHYVLPLAGPQRGGVRRLLMYVHTILYSVHNDVGKDGNMYVKV